MSTAADNRFYREKPAARDDGGPAFPVEVGTRPIGQNWHQTGPDTAQHYGLSLRDYFAAKALPLAWAAEQERPTGAYSDHMEPTYAGAATQC